MSCTHAARGSSCGIAQRGRRALRTRARMAARRQSATTRANSRANKVKEYEWHIANMKRAANGADCAPWLQSDAQPTPCSRLSAQAERRCVTQAQRSRELLRTNVMSARHVVAPPACEQKRATATEVNEQFAIHDAAGNAPSSKLGTRHRAVTALSVVAVAHQIVVSPYACGPSKYSLACVTRPQLRLCASHPSPPAKCPAAAAASSTHVH